MSLKRFMNRSQRLLGGLVALLLPVVMAGCADTNGGITSEAPTVTMTAPARAVTEVPTDRSITATFSAAMDPATINTSTFVLRSFDDADRIQGIVTLDTTSNIATFKPVGNLQPDTAYLATITSEVKATTGVAMAADYFWSFETAPIRDTTAPTVIFTSAYGTTGATSGATGLPVNRGSSVAFSEPMDSATLSSPAITFTVKETGSGKPVAGVVTYIGISATFTPTIALSPDTAYTSTVTTAARDLAGNPMATDYSWTWATGAAPDTVSPKVTITTPADHANNVPVYKTISATFSEEMKQATMITTNVTVKQTASNINVPGTVAYDVQNNVATFLPIGNLAPDTDYTVTISGAATDLAGNALVAGAVGNPWTFRTAASPVTPTVTLTTPARGVTGVPLDRSITATFSDAMKPATINSPATNFTLKEFDSAALIPGTVTLDQTSNIATFRPNSPLAPNTSYVATISTGVQSLAGTPMAADYNWSFTTSLTSDTTAPKVISTGAYGNSGLISGAIDLPINRASSATFSEAMNPATIASPATSFTLKESLSGNPISGTVSYIGTTATFTPSGLLTPLTSYTSTIATAAKDLAGNPIAADYVWSWKTAVTADITAPTVTFTSPANLATQVPVSKTINATFSEEMKQATIITTNFTVKETDTNLEVQGTVAYDVQNNIASFLPNGDLKPSTNYTATVSNGATDLAGNALASQTTGAIRNPWSFTTAADATVPVPSPVALGAVAAFASYGGTAGMTSQGLDSFLDGDIGTTAVSTAVTGFHDMSGDSYTETPLNRGTVNGKIYTYPPAPGDATTMAVADAALAAAQVAYLQLKALPGGSFAGAGELGLLTLEPGTYTSATTFNITSGDLTLDGKGDPNALFVFQVGQALTVGKAGPDGACSIILVNGAKAKNIFWQVGSSATINGAGGGTMEGTIIAQQAITFSTAGNAAITTLNGRALSLISGVTMVNTHIFLPAP